MSADAGDTSYEYEARPLRRADVAPDPIEQFERWFEEARAESARELTNAMTLATAGSDGRPSARMVLLKGVEAEGFLFYTNYRSRKGRELAENPWAALVFWWPDLERQIRITGWVERVDEERSDAYFSDRPRESQLSAWASDQSTVVPGRASLRDRMEAARSRFEDRAVPRPEYWGGYRLDPGEFEFWQGQPHRLHDRIRYRRKEGGWTIDRLAP